MINIFPPFSNFEKPEKILWHDKVLSNTILRFFPKSVKPNHLTIIRLLATPVVILLMYYQNYIIGLMAFLLTAFTDALDGSMARTRNQITDWGKIYDPLADKILIGSMVFVVVVRYVDLWTGIAIIVLEVFFIISALIKIKKHKKVQANVWGKIKMILQVSGVVLLLFSVIFDFASLIPYASNTLYLAIAFAIVSLLTQGI